MIDHGRAEVARTVTSIRRADRCPLCGVRARRVRSRYERRLAHVPWSEYRRPLVTPRMEVVPIAPAGIIAGQMGVSRHDGLMVMLQAYRDTHNFPLHLLA